MADDINDRIRDLDPELGAACDESDRDHDAAGLRAELGRWKEKCWRLEGDMKCRNELTAKLAAERDRAEKAEAEAKLYRVAVLTMPEFGLPTRYGSVCLACGGHQSTTPGVEVRGPDRGHLVGCALRAALDAFDDAQTDDGGRGE